MKLTDTIQEQELLEELLEEMKPRVPAECRHLDYLLYSPFRYRPYPKGSRFRRAGMTPGVFYAAEAVDTAAAEMSFYRLLFFAESAATPWPANPAEYTAFSVAYDTLHAVDLTAPPYDAHESLWMHPTEYGPCQEIAELTRAASAQAIRYRSVRDPGHRPAMALLACSAFVGSAPVNRQTWRIHLSPTGLRAICEFPHRVLEFGREAFAADPRIAGVQWDR